MRQWKFSLLYLFTVLFVFFNIERLDFGVDNIINFQSFVYVLGIVAVLLIIAMPIWTRLDVRYVVAIWAAVYMTMKLLFGTNHPLIGGVYTYLTVTELGFLLMTTYLAYRVAEGVRRLEEAAVYMTLAHAGEELPTLEKATSLIRQEMTRSRHFHRNLGVIMVQPDVTSLKDKMPSLIAEIQRSVADRVMTIKLGQLMGEEVRVVDTVLEDKETGRLVILCPESDANGVNLLAERIKHIVSDRLDVPVQCATASFPDEAITFEALIHEANDKLSAQQTRVMSPMTVQRVRPELVHTAKGSIAH